MLEGASMYLLFCFPTFRHERGTWPILAPASIGFRLEDTLLFFFR